MFRFVWTYRIPEHVVQMVQPMVILTAVTPFWPQSKQVLLLPEATISRKLFSILLSLLSAFAFIILLFFFCLFFWVNHQMI